MSQTLQSGISVLKTTLCEEKLEDELFQNLDCEMNESQPVNENGECPTCEPKMRSLGRELPSSLHTLTQVSCSITGLQMNDSNPPFYLPSGYLISEQAKLRLIAEQNHGASLEQLLMTREPSEIKLRCPFSDRLFSESELRKVYFS